MWHNRERAIDSRLVRSAPDAFRLSAYGITPEGGYLYVNDSACASLGDTRDELLRMTVAEVDPDCLFDARQAPWSKLKHLGGLPRTIRSVNDSLRGRKDRARLLQDAERNRAERCVWAG